ncbi:TIGR00730 family Rossman fold protein [Spirosoma sp. KNUC1025]|uniref:LOG family protein n=1 Tax=Spirosoma sp. KNUC1025 TaxID=2894082 RepID=UPI00386A4C76|nr:TIGR00730 family Rossman fold protein [Spirosoma sp. KNUC1025]
MHSIKRVCVYCASSAQVDRAYFDATERLATAFVDNQIDVVYGGGGIGLMGQLADTVLEKGGRITGIMPNFMREVEWAHKKVTDFVFTASMHERKQKFLEEVDGLVALAGGTGTLEELFEAITLKRLGLFTKPIIILNTRDYYAPLKEMLDRGIAENFMAPVHRSIWTFVDEPEQVIDALQNAPVWSEDAIRFATLR